MQDSMLVSSFYKFFAYVFSSPTLKQYFIRQYYRSYARCFKYAFYMMPQIELLVAGGYPKILAVLGEAFFFVFTFFVGEGDVYPTNSAKCIHNYSSFICFM